MDNSEGVSVYLLAGMSGESRTMRILLADDHLAFREGLCRVLEDEGDIQVVASVGDGNQATAAAAKLRPDLAIVDVAMPPGSGIETARSLLSVSPNTRVLMLSAYDYNSYVLGALKAGAAGYLLKTVSLAKLIDAIRLIYAGEAVFDLGATRHALAGVLSSHQMGQGATKSELLHNRELQLLRLVGRGLRNKQVADQLGISERTVQTHLLNIFRKLGVNSRTEAVVRAVRDGMITFDELS